MYILGLNVYHADSSAALLKDGELLAAVEEERFNRQKHWSGFPVQSVQYCLEASNISAYDIDFVCTNRDPRANLGRKLIYVLKNRPSLAMLADRIKNRQRIAGVREEFLDRLELDAGKLKASFLQVEHHRAHLASSFFVSPFSQAALISVDGFGDFVSTMLARGNDRKIEIIDSTYFPHSLGLFYLAITQYLGFVNYGEEYKVMGLASYGEPKYVDLMREIITVDAGGHFSLNLRHFVHNRNGFEMSWENTTPRLGKVFSSSLEEVLGPARDPGEPLTTRHKDMAATLQHLYEEAFFALLNRLYKNTGFDNLCVAGGCALNSVANGKIFEKTPFRKLYIQPAAGDAGGAIGAAFYGYHEELGQGRSWTQNHAYWGPHFSGKQIQQLLEQRRDKLSREVCEIRRIDDETELCRITAEAIAAGQIVGWFQGRMEWGPRALGNRSILGDPRRSDMKSILNQKIKRRESFRPFAPAIQREHVAEYFETDYDVPFMQQVYLVRDSVREKIPAVTHVDGSGRLQTVTRDQNTRFWNLIEAFEKISGIPLVLNTSFNENEPIVCQPEEALDCFVRTKMDMLVLNDYVVRRPSRI